MLHHNFDAEERRLLSRTPRGTHIYYPFSNHPQALQARASRGSGAGTEHVPERGHQYERSPWRREIMVRSKRVCKQVIALAGGHIVIAGEEIMRRTSSALEG